MFISYTVTDTHNNRTMWHGRFNRLVIAAAAYNYLITEYPEALGYVLTVNFIQ